MNHEIEVCWQKGDDLGVRLLNAFSHTFKQGAKKIVFVGVDNPFLSEEVIISAFAKLDNYACVIGPRDDGGYYLLGMNCLIEALFADISWGTEVVLRQSLGRLKDENISVALIEKGFDVDRKEDLAKLRESLNNPDFLNDREYDKLRNTVNAVLI